MTKISTQSKSLTIRVPDSENLKEVQKQARQLVRDKWQKAHPEVHPNQGGRPSVRDRVFSACEELITTFEKDRFLKDYSQEELVNRVMSRFGLNKPHKKTVEKHVKHWFYQLPLRYWPKAKVAQHPKALEVSVLGLIHLKINRELYWPWLLTKMPKEKTFNELVKWEEREKPIPPRSLQQKMDKEFTRLLQDTLAKDPSLEKHLRRHGLLS